ncbi:hypothetical protein [Cryobacterium sp. Y11]|uniref:hypothetical protein n=1 Tax=Cryobacterium sp. Y11 TaxID=2045016 RepID=UPI0011AFD689|nr:hypothetical protein [Cryobacterium sp. Y11]
MEEIVGQDGPELRRTIVSETLAFGWIDGEGDSIDSDCTMRYFPAASANTNSRLCASEGYLCGITGDDRFFAIGVIDKL